MKVHILHILDSLNVGGLENGVVNLINRLSPDVFKHSICCIRAVGSMAERIITPGVQITCLNVASRDRLLALKLRKIILNLKPDIVHTRNWGTIDGILAARLAGLKRLIHSEHGREAQDINGRNAIRNMVRFLISFYIDRYLTVSEEMQKWLSQTIRVSGDKAISIVNGVDTDKFRPAESKEEAKRKIGIAPDLKLIGTVGRLDRIKDYPMLLNALVQVHNRLPEHKLVFVGDGPERGHLEYMAKQNGLDQVVFFGNRDNVRDYLKAFDLFVLPSISEGISNTILEALSTGVLVVATAVGGTPELIQDGFNGYLVPSGDADALGEKIEKVFFEPDQCRKIADQARKHCLKNFSMDTMAGKYSDLYLGLMKKPG